MHRQPPAPPKESKPEVYNEMKTPSIISTSENPFKYQPVPEVSLYGAKLKADHLSKKNILFTNEANQFVNAVQDALSKFDKNSNRYSEDILLFCMSACENAILGKKQGELKLQMVKACVKPFFNNDELLIEKWVSLLMPNILNYKFWNRNLRKLARFFLNCVSMKQQAPSPDTQSKFL